MSSVQGFGLVTGNLVGMAVWSGHSRSQGAIVTEHCGSDIEVLVSIARVSTHMLLWLLLQRPA